MGFALVKTCGSVGAFLGPFLIGWLADLLHGYSGAMLMLAGVAAAAAALVCGGLGCQGGKSSGAWWPGWRAAEAWCEAWRDAAQRWPWLCSALLSGGGQPARRLGRQFNSARPCERLKSSSSCRPVLLPLMQCSMTPPPDRANRHAALLGSKVRGARWYRAALWPGWVGQPAPHLVFFCSLEDSMLKKLTRNQTLGPAAVREYPARAAVHGTGRTGRAACKQDEVHAGSLASMPAPRKLLVCGTLLGLTTPRYLTTCRVHRPARRCAGCAMGSCIRCLLQEAFLHTRSLSSSKYSIYNYLLLTLLFCAQRPTSRSGWVGERWAPRFLAPFLHISCQRYISHRVSLRLAAQGLGPRLYFLRASSNGSKTQRQDRHAAAHSGCA